MVQAPILRSGGYQEINVTQTGAMGSVGSVHLRPAKNGQTYLSDLSVSPDHRRHGVAKMLVQAAQRVSSAQGHSGIVLEASPSAGSIDPQSLISMYQRMGFRRMGFSERGKPLLQSGPVALQPKMGPRTAAHNVQPAIFPSRANSIQRMVASYACPNCHTELWSDPAEDGCYKCGYGLVVEREKTPEPVVDPYAQAETLSNGTIVDWPALTAVMAGVQLGVPVSPNVWRAMRQALSNAITLENKSHPGHGSNFNSPQRPEQQIVDWATPIQGPLKVALSEYFQQKYRVYL
jgi:hypothetical protein